MEAERKRSKGSFLNLFEWNGKSRKKLYANNSESLEGSVEGKEKGESRTKSRYAVIEVNDRRAFNHDANDYSCASSVTSDEGCHASRPPGVVARLMGLDSLPTSSIHDPSATLLSNSQSLKASPYNTAVPHSWSQNNPMVFQDVYSRRDPCSMECMKPRPHKLQSRPIERFQLEMMPPKSAKTIPITHHKLLSPIRKPGLMTRENVAYVMDAAANIMEASPRATNNKMPSITSSTPVRIRDLKQKMEAAHTTSVVQRNSIHGSSQGRQHQSLNGSEDMRSNTVPVPFPKGTSDGAKRKGVSASTVKGSKATEQRRQGSPSRNIVNMKEKSRNEVKSNMISRRPPASEKSVAKSGRNTDNALRQNNQKQNVTISKDGSASKQSAVRKVQTTNVSGVPSRTMNKTAYRPETVSRKMVAGSSKEKLDGVSQLRRSVDTYLAADTSSSGIVSFNRDGRVIKCTVAMDCLNDMPQHNMKNGTDVVSFTFSSPIKTKPSFQSSSPPLELLGGQDTSFKNLSSLPMGNVVGADALGSLLEKKLKELTEKVQSSNYNFIREKTSANAHDPMSALSPDISKTRQIGNRRLFQSSPDASTSDQSGELECFLPTNSRGSAPQKSEQTNSEEMEEHSSSSGYSEAGKECLGPSPVSILEPLYKSGNFSKAQSFKLLSAAQEVHNAISDVESFDVDETEASESISLISVADVRISPLAEACAFDEEVSGDSEMNYLKGMLSNAHLILEEFASGRTSKVMEYHLFDWLENRENEPGRNAVEYSKLEQKLLFDCAIEWLDSACARVSLGGCKAWSRLWTSFQREGWAAEKLLDEIHRWRSMESLMVDEIVDKDMSSQFGKWIDFDQEAFEEGVEIENEMLTSLVDELLSDLLNPLSLVYVTTN